MMIKILLITFLITVAFASLEEIKKDERVMFQYASRPNPQPNPNPPIGPVPVPVPATCSNTLFPNSKTANLASNSMLAFAADCLKAHNYYRNIHHVPPMTLNTEMNIQAQAYAQYLADSGKFEHSTSDARFGQGENLFTISGAIPCGNVACDYWYDEIKDYPNYVTINMANFPKFGHFTQMVWKASIVLGCGFATKGTRTVVVARYSPAGNMQGAFPDNVIKP